jgi:hypothetical protein
MQDSKLIDKPLSLLGEYVRTSSNPWAIKDYPDCHAKTPVSLGTLPAKLPPLYLSFTPTYLLRKSSVNPYILKLFK